MPLPSGTRPSNPPPGPLTLLRSLFLLPRSFAVLCKVCEPCLASDGTSVELHNIDALERATEGIARFLLGFFAEDHRGDPGGGSGSGDNDSDNEGEGKGEGDGEREGRLILRPLTNSNFVVDFYRHTSSPYYFAMTEYLTHLLGDGKRRSNDGDGGKGDVVNYGRQYQLTMDYYKSGGGHIHGYERFTHCGSMSSIPNAKSLRPVTGTDGAVFSLARYDYYRYRAVNLMFGFNSGIMHGLRGFCEFNALRKNQLLRFYDDIGEETKEYPRALAAARSATKYRDYCEFIIRVTRPGAMGIKVGRRGCEKREKEPCASEGTHFSFPECPPSPPLLPAPVLLPLPHSRLHAAVRGRSAGAR